MKTTALMLERFDPDRAPEPSDAWAPVAAPRPRGRLRAAPPPPPPPAPTEAEISARVARARGEGRAEGFAEGAAEAEARGLAELRLIAADLREQLADAALLLAERRAAETDRLRGLAEALLAGVAPALARRGLAAEVADAALDALRPRGQAPVQPPRIRVSPDQVRAVSDALAALDLSAPVIPDPSLGPLRARLDWAEGEDALDLDAALDAARAAIARRFAADAPHAPAIKVTAHG